MEVKIIDIVESTTFDDRGTLEKIMLARYKVGNLGPFTVSMPKIQFSSQKIKELIDKEAEEIQKLYTT